MNARETNIQTIMLNNLQQTLEIHRKVDQQETKASKNHVPINKDVAKGRWNKQNQ